MKKNINNIAIHKNKWLLLYLILSLVVILYSLSYPPLNWPDEIYKISNMYNTDNFYFILIDWIQEGGCGISYSSLTSEIYGNNKFHYKILSGVYCYRELKIINSLLIITTILLCMIFIKNNMRRIFLMSILWPSSIFFLTSVNNQVVFHIISIALGVHSLYARTLLMPIFLSLILISIDRSFITALIFFSFLQGFKYQKIATILVFASIFLFSQISTGVLENIYSAIFLDSQTLIEVRNSNEIFRDSIFFSIAIFLVSFVYLGGTASVFGIGFDYVFVYFYLIKNYFKIENKNEINLNVISLFMAIYLVLQFVPSIQSFRYYVFMIPIIIKFFVKEEKERYYITYCISMNVIYLLLAYSVQGGSQ